MAYDWAWGSGVQIQYFANPDVSYQGARTGQVNGYNATGDARSDSRYVPGGLEGTHGAGFDGSNALLGARNGPYILTQVAGRAALRTRAAFQVVTPATGAAWNPGETREIYWRGGDSAPSMNPVPAGGSSVVEVTFAPDSAQPFEALLGIASSDPVLPLFEMRLTGEGEPAPVLVVEHPAGAPLVSGAGAVNFGSVTLTAPAATRAVTIRNAGPDSVLRVTGFQISGTHPREFELIGEWPAVLAGSAEIAPQVRFQPLGGGLRQASLTLFSNDPLRPTFEVNLAGEALVLPGPGQEIVVRDLGGRVPAAPPLLLSAWISHSSPIPRR